jgi:ketosteroid isomerase-like protein
MKKFLFLGLVASLLLSCAQPNPYETKLPDFRENAKVVHALFDALENEDLEAAASFYSEETQFNPPAFGGKVLNKTELMELYGGMMQLMSNIKANDRDFYPGVDNNFYPDGSVRAYIRWTADAENGAIGEIKAYEVFRFNEEHKITEVDEYLDNTGLLNAITAASE